MGNSLIALGEAVDIDPTFVEAWTARGRLACEAGDLYSGLEYLDAALVVAKARRGAGRPVEPEVMMEIYRERAWALRDLARWDEGLEAVQEGLEFKHGDHDLVLINPPFHQQHSIGDAVAWQMFMDARRVLVEGGELRIVGNRHLGYHAKLKKLFGNCETVDANKKFVVLSATK